MIFRTYNQHNQMDCGPTCLRMGAKYHGRKYSLESLRRKSGINREGVSLLALARRLSTYNGSPTWRKRPLVHLCSATKHTK
ncbi:MAG: hypothetical protein FH748_15785 [Balneolaceae bacterium]|nr:hypothetical protein [Balneolaceae bacterium]